MLSIGPVLGLSSKLKNFGLTGNDLVGRNIADIGSGSGMFPEEVLQEGASEVFAVDISYNETFSIFKNKASETVKFFKKNLEDHELMGYVFGIPREEIRERINIVNDSVERVINRKKISNLNNIADLPNGKMDHIFMSNMLLGVEDVENFIKTLKVKLKIGGRIFIAEYSPNEEKLKEIKELGGEKISESDGITYFQL